MVSGAKNLEGFVGRPQDKAFFIPRGTSWQGMGGLGSPSL